MNTTVFLELIDVLEKPVVCSNALSYFKNMTNFVAFILN